MNKPHILIVEDEYFIYEGIHAVLSDEGYSVAGFTPSVADAEKEIKKQRPDVVLLDIDLLGEENGIDLGKKLLNTYHIPFIYVTGLDDRLTFNKALDTKHKIFMVKTKPVLDYKTLLRHVETVLYNNRETAKTKPDPINTEPDTIGLSVLSGYLNDIKNGGKDQLAYIKILWNDIVFISKDNLIDAKVQEKESKEKEPKEKEPKGNYILFAMKDGNNYFLKTSLKKIVEILPDYFSRINSQYIINIKAPEFKGMSKGNTIILNDRKLKLSRSYKEAFLEKLNKYFPNYQILD